MYQYSKCHQLLVNHFGSSVKWAGLIFLGTNITTYLGNDFGQLCDELRRLMCKVKLKMETI